MDYLADYEVIGLALEEAKAQMSSAEAHGLASGMLCASLQAPFERWMDVVFDEPGQQETISKEDVQLFAGMFQGTGEHLQGEDFLFDLLLPDDDELVSVRAQALSEWCQGFLYGVAFMGVNDETAWGEEGRGVLRDLMEISRLDAESSQESDENAFVELHEYVRMAVQVMMNELNNEPPQNAEQTSPTLH